MRSEALRRKKKKRVLFFFLFLARFGVGAIVLHVPEAWVLCEILEGY